MTIKKTQREAIREYLEDGKTLTPLDALSLFGCFRLATRIFELKKQGLDIKTEMVTDGESGKKYARYYLPKASRVRDLPEDSVLDCRPLQPVGGEVADA